MNLGPQAGPQTRFLQSSAEITLYGGAGGGGKTYGLLLDTLRFFNHKVNFPYTIFRREMTQIKNPGSIFDEATKMFMPLGAKVNNSKSYFLFENGLKVQFAHLEHEKTVFNWHGSQMPVIAFDELCTFTEHQFFYMLSRNRGTTGLGGYIRATCNPDPDSFVRRLIDWWIGEDGFPIKERSGVVRYFTRYNDDIIWHDKRVLNSKSFTFIPSKLEDNKILMEKDPGYRVNLEALNYVDRMRLLHGNWNIRPNAGMYFKRHYFEILDALPAARKVTVRYWDRAASVDKDAAYTVGVKMHRYDSGLIVIEDVRRLRGTPLEVRDAIRNTAIQDGQGIMIGIEQDPGQAGVVEATDYVRLLSGFTVKLNKVSKDKVTRAGPFSSQCEAKNVKLLRRIWNDSYLSELESFPIGKFTDQVDASSGAFNLLTQGLSGSFTKDMAAKSATHAPGLKGNNQW